MRALLSRHRALTVGALIVLTAGAWAWLAIGAGSGMAASFDLALFPHRTSGMGMNMPWTGARLLLALAMWWVMMIAMMLPAAAPTILLYERSAPDPRSATFLGGYLSVWLAFSMIAVGVQMAFTDVGLMGGMSMTLAVRWASGMLLIAAGLYQFTPLKDACLAQCRSPAAFLARHFRPGAAGAFRLGWIHGVYCVGCCWLLMALLFVGGVMNLAWITALTALVAAEKLLPAGRRVARIGGCVLMLWGVAILLVE